MIGAAAGAVTPQLVTVLVGGKSYQVPSEVAQSIAEEQESFYRDRGRLTGELTQLKTRPAEKTSSSEPTGPQRPSARLATEDIEEWDRQMAVCEAHRDLRIEQRLEEKLSKRETEREKATQDRTQLQIFIARVGKEKQALDGEENVILTAMSRLAKKYPNDPLPFADPRTLKLVTEEASAELTRLAAKGKSLAPGVPHIEGQGGRGGTSAGDRTEQRTKATEPISIADIQRMKRKRRLAAAGGRLGREED